MAELARKDAAQLRLAALVMAATACCGWPPTGPGSVTAGHRNMRSSRIWPRWVGLSGRCW